MRFKIYWEMFCGNGILGEIKLEECEKMSELKTANNMTKYENYKEQFKRLKKAMASGFYLEAVFIEYAIFEDRAESILSYEGNEIHSENHVSIERKLNKIKKIAEAKKSLPRKYFSDEFIDEIINWKEERNRLIHALMKQSLTTEELRSLALNGHDLVRTFCNKSNLYKRAVSRQNNKQGVNYER